MIEKLLIPYKIPMINTCKDEEIKSVLLFALDLSKKCVHQIETVYRQESHPIPIGFGKEDMNTEAPALFTDNFYLLYIHEMAKQGSQTIEITERNDILDILYNTLNNYKELYRRTLNLLLY